MTLTTPDPVMARLDHLERGADGRARAAMTLVPGRGAALALADRNGAVVWSAP